MIDRVLSAAGGVVLAGATRAVAALRPAAKPLHPSGTTLRGRIHRHGSDSPSGVPWLDERGEDDAVVRLSRAVGLPAALPDVHGLAIRVLLETGDADLLLASTGWGSVGRFVLTASRDPARRPMTTLLPYRTARGPLLIGCRAVTPTSYRLFWAHRDGPWHEFGELLLSDRPGPPGEVSFDPVRHQLPGLEQYPTVVRLREPSYRNARASSARSVDDSPGGSTGPGDAR